MTQGLLTKKIEANQQNYEDEHRDYIGASSIGSPCLRKIWYAYKGEKSENIPSKIRRTWAIGTHLESLVLDWLERAGIKIIRFWCEFQSKNVESFQGHIDSMWVDEANNPKAIIEIKTAKDSSFKMFSAKGLKLWNPQYYAQIQSYMGMSAIHLAYIVVLNKDNSELLDEAVYFDADFYHSLEEKACMIAEAVSPPPRVNGSPLWYLCKTCRFNKTCHQKGE